MAHRPARQDVLAKVLTGAEAIDRSRGDVAHGRGA